MSRPTVRRTRSRTDALLERGARLGRATPFSEVLRTARGWADRGFTALGHAPLAAELEGVRLRGFLRHRSFLHAVAGGEYEPMTRELITERLEPGVVFVDGGAHIGLYSLLVGVRCPSANVFAFEPDPYNFQALELNLRGVSARVNAFNVALADEDAKASGFHISSGTIGGSLVKRSEVSDIEQVLSVKTMTIDRILADVELDGLIIELDVEGSEAATLRGAQVSLSRSRWCRIIVEQNAPALNDAGEPPDAVIRLLVDQGFSVAEIDEAERCVRAVNVDSPPRKGNLVADRGMRCR